MLRQASRHPRSAKNANSGKGEDCRCCKVWMTIEEQDKSRSSMAL